VTPLSGYAHPQFSDAGLQSMLSFGFRSSSLLECILLNQEPLYIRYNHLDSWFIAS